MSQVHNPNQIFLNLAAANTSPQTQIGCEFKDERTRDVIQDTGAYNVALVNFSLPSSSIGLQKWANDGTRTVTLKHTASGDVFTSEILWVDMKAGTPDVSGLPSGELEPPPGGELELGSGSGAGASGWVYSASEIIQATNKALAEALNLLLVVHSGPEFANAPEIVIESGKCVLYFPLDMFGAAGLFVSAATERLYSGVTATLLEVPLSQSNTAEQLATQYKYMINPTASNTVVLSTIDFIRSEQQKPTVSSWWTPRQLLVGIHGISVGGELMPAGDTGGNAESLLTNFHVDGSAVLSGGALIFYQQGPHRWYELGDSTGVRSTSARVYLETPDGDREPLQLAYGETATIRLLFRRSELGLA
jgi:hypothetical protein